MKGQETAHGWSSKEVELAGQEDQWWGRWPCPKWEPWEPKETNDETGKTQWEDLIASNSKAFEPGCPRGEPESAVMKLEHSRESQSGG